MRRSPELILAVFLLALRGALAGLLGPGRDELAYWYWAHHALDTSYSLVTTGAIWLATSLFGDGPAAIRLPGLLAGGLTVAIVGRSVRALGGSFGAAALAMLAVTASPWQGYVGTVAHPDAFLSLFVVGYAAAAMRLRQESESESAGALIALAACAGLTAWTKLTGAILLAPALWLAWRCRRAQPAGSVTAALIIVGVAASLLATLDVELLRGLRAFGTFDGRTGPLGRVGIIAAKLVGFGGPALLLLAGFGAHALARSGRRGRWPLGGAAALWIGFFTLFLFVGQAKANWFLPALLWLVPPGAVALEAGVRGAAGGGSEVPFAARATRGAAYFTFALSVLGAGVWALPHAPTVWPRVVAAPAVQRIDGTYAQHVGPREAEVSPCRTWTARLAEYGPPPPLDSRIRAALEAPSASPPRLTSHDYGLAFALAWRYGRDVKVHLPWDSVFRRSSGSPLAAGESTIWVSTAQDAPPADWAAGFASVAEISPPGGIDSDLRVFLCSDAAGGSRPDQEESMRSSLWALFAGVALAGSAPSLDSEAGIAAATEPAEPEVAATAPFVDHSEYDALLQKYVTPYGVRYAAWHANETDRVALQTYLRRLQAAAPSRWAEREGGRAHALAYWINVYNAVTLDLILDNYPVKSIKDLGNLIRTPWKKKLFSVEGEPLTLNEIENEIIRPQFNEPRIHFAVNCAAISCPPLRGEAYTAERLEEQLEEMTRLFLADPKRTFLDEEGRLHLSKILDWYREDFETDDSGLVDYVRRYSPAVQDLKPGEKVDLKFNDYDWALNEFEEPAES